MPLTAVSPQGLPGTRTASAEALSADLAVAEVPVAAASAAAEASAGAAASAAEASTVAEVSVAAVDSMEAVEAAVSMEVAAEGTAVNRFDRKGSRDGWIFLAWR